jgi:hypothetical protein
MGLKRAVGDNHPSQEKRFCIVPASPLDKIRAWNILKKRGTNVGRITPPHARKITEKWVKKEKAKSEEKNWNEVCKPLF